jgi:hypothetical protein
VHAKEQSLEVLARAASTAMAGFENKKCCNECKSKKFLPIFHIKREIYNVMTSEKKTRYRAQLLYHLGYTPKIMPQKYEALLNLANFYSFSGLEVNNKQNNIL